MSEFLEGKSFLDAIDYDKLLNQLKEINIILKDEQSQESMLILSIENTRKIIQYIKTLPDDDNVSEKNKVEVLGNVIAIHQGLLRISSDKTLELSDKFYEKSQDALSHLAIFYPAFIFNSSLINHPEEEV